MDFEKLLGEQIFKNHNCIPFLYSIDSLSIRVSFLYFALLFICYLNVLSFYFYISLNSVAGSHSLNFGKFSDTAPFKRAQARHPALP